jgi:ERF superfamily
MTERTESAPIIEGQKIYQDLVALRRKIGGLKAEKKGGVSFPVKSAKDLMDKLRKAADELGMPMAAAPIAVEFQDREVQGKTMFTCKTTVRFMSSDGSFVDFVGVGQGGDGQDKAGGKASTYAYKDACVKGLTLPDAELVDTDDEETPLAPKIEESKPAPPLGKILGMFNAAATRADLEAAKNEVRKYTNWTPDERNQLANVAERAKGRVAQ